MFIARMTFRMTKPGPARRLLEGSMFLDDFTLRKLSICRYLSCEINGDGFIQCLLFAVYCWLFYCLIWLRSDNDRQSLVDLG